MTGRSLLAAAVAGALVASASAGSAVAASAVTFVSGLGRDSGACTRTAPCRRFRYAITQTSPGGTIAALDRAGFGPVTITQAVTILGLGKGGAGMSPNVHTSASVGVEINAAGATVILRGLEIDGGYDGIRILQAARVIISDSVITGSSNLAIDEIDQTASVLVQDTTVSNAEVDNYAATFVAKRLTVAGSRGFGVFVARGHVVLDDCTISGSPNLGIDVDQGTTVIKQNVSAYNTDPNFGGGGIFVGPNAVAYIDSTTTFANSPRGINSSGTAFSYGNNNFPDGAIGTITPIAGD